MFRVTKYQITHIDPSFVEVNLEWRSTSTFLKRIDPSSRFTEEIFERERFHYYLLLSCTYKIVATFHYHINYAPKKENMFVALTSMNLNQFDA